MSPDHPAIHVSHLGKKYTIGGPQEKYRTFRDAIVNSAKAPLRRLSSSEPPQEFWALKDVSFDVEPGEVVGIIGRNGAGKSTLLKILSRITSPTEGTVDLYGRVGSLLEVGTGFHPELTGRENIFLSGSILGMKKREIEDRLDEIVKFSEIEKFLDTPAKRYSSGMYVRLAFAVAAHMDTEILLIDEVLAVGDAAFQKKCMGKMGEVAKEGRTVLFVSHNLTAIKTLCSRAILLKEGKIFLDDLAESTVKKYATDIQNNILFKEWESELHAPQNTNVVLKKVWITKSDETDVQEIYTNTAFNIHILFKIKRDNSSAGLTIIIYDNENTLAFSSINNLEPNWYGKPMSGGYYESICQIPANFLNNIGYHMNIIIFNKNFSDAITIKDILIFEIIDSVDIRGDFFGVVGGIIRPKFEWLTKKLN